MTRRLRTVLKELSVEQELLEGMLHDTLEEDLWKPYGLSGTTLLAAGFVEGATGRPLRDGSFETAILADLIHHIAEQMVPWYRSRSPRTT